MKGIMAPMLLTFLLSILCGETSLAQIGPGYMRQENPMMNHSMVRHRFVRQKGIPQEYRNISIPVKVSEDNLRDGAGLFAAHCAACHGDHGRGDGPAGRALNPRPSDLVSTVRMPIATDPYLFWTIAEGGRELDTAMPSFKEALTKDEIGKIILFLRFSIAKDR